MQDQKPPQPLGISEQLAGFQERVKKWNDHNFPNKLPHQPLLGVVEECCAELQTADDLIDWHDAVGDTLIYLADYANNNFVVLATALEQFTRSLRQWDMETSISSQDYMIRITVYIGALAHAHLKMEQGIRGTREEHLARKERAVGGILFHVLRFVPDAMELAFGSLSVIEKRDWIKYPGNGLPPCS